MKDTKKKYEVYGYIVNNSQALFSKGVTRDFGENRIVFVDGLQILANVQPLHDANGLDLVGYLYV
jgi:hypothetical protein